MSNAADRKTQPMGALVVPGHTRLTVVHGAVPTGMTWSLAGDRHSIGRGKVDIDLVEDGHVNEHHATVELRGDSWTVVDESSQNGVYVRLREPVALKDGQFFRVGQQIFRFEVMDDSSEQKDEEGTTVFTSPARATTFRVLQVLEGGVPGRSVTSTSGEVTIGGDGATVGFSADNFLSKRHARVYDSGNGHMLEDMGSTNGTYVRIEKEHELSDGDLIAIGEQLLRVDVV